MSQKIEVFVQGEGCKDIHLLTVERDAPVGEILMAAREAGIATTGGDVVLFVEDTEDEFGPEQKLLDVGIQHRHRVHCHRCRHVRVGVNFNGVSADHDFRPSATIARVKRWADEHFGLKGVDASDHVLQLCGGTVRPDEDVHVGTLTEYPHCSVCFDLVPKKRVQGTSEV